MKVRPTQSREGVKGKISPCRVKGQRPLWGLGQRPNCSSSDQSQGSRQQRRRQRSVPASNFARPQTRPPSCSFHHLRCVAPNGRDQRAWKQTKSTIARWKPLICPELEEKSTQFTPKKTPISQCFHEQRKEPPTRCLSCEEKTSCCARTAAATSPAFCHGQTTPKPPAT